MYVIIGASGFIGRHIYAYCRRSGIDVLGTYFAHSSDAEWVKFDICADDFEDMCKKHLKGQTLEAVIVCGANASIDSCKKDENASNQLNVTGTRRILRQADKMGAKCVFLSSEAVFDGKKGLYTEKDIPHPVTLYGRQKLEIEQYIIHNLKHYLIFRISRATGSSFGEKDIFNEFYEKMIDQREIICLKNQSFCLTHIDDIVYGIIKALERDLCGLYHLSSTNYVTRYELAQNYANRIFGGYENIKEKEYAEMNFLDNRHIYGGLIGEKFEQIMGFHYMGMQRILDNYCDSYKSIVFNKI